MLALEDSLQHKLFSHLASRHFSHRKYGNVLSSDLRMIQKDISSVSDTGKLLHYLNWNQRALSIIQDIFEPPEYDLPEDLNEHSWAEVQSAPIGTSSKRLHIIVTETDSASIAYFTQQPITQSARAETIELGRTKQLMNAWSVKIFIHLSL